MILNSLVFFIRIMIYFLNYFYNHFVQPYWLVIQFKCVVELKKKGV